MRAIDDLPTWAAAYRDGRRAPDALRERVLAAVHDDEAPPVKVSKAKPWGAWAIGLGVGGVIGVAALLLLSWVVRWVRPDAAPASTPSVAPYERSSADEGSTASRPRARTQGAVTERAAEETAAIVEAPSATSTTTPTSTSTSTSTTTTTSASTAATAKATEPAPLRPSVDLESLRRLRAAEALLASDPSRARALIEAHALDFPDSNLALEREALWIRAACRTGGAPGLDRRRAAFAKRSGVAAYRAAIEKDCAR